MAVIEICVTEDDIAKGARHDPHSCPIAIAMKRTLSVDWVSAERMFLDNHAQDKAAITPRVARNFMDAFDRGAAVEPFCFDARFV